MSYRPQYAQIGAGGLFNPSIPGPIGGTTPAAGTFTTITGAIIDKGGQVFNAQAYDWLPDSTDRSIQASALLAIVYTAGGGTIYFPRAVGKYRADSQWLFPNNGGSPRPAQPSIRLSGAGAGKNWWVFNAGAPCASILDLRYQGPGAKLTTLGVGALSIDNLCFTDGGSTNTTPFVLSTNTTIVARDVTFNGVGNVAQDAFILGGTNEHIGGLITDGYQGYGALFDGCMFEQVNRGIYGRTYANNISVVDCAWENASGTRALEIDGGTYINLGWYVAGNLIEMDTTYNYGIVLGNTQQGTFIGNSMWDHTVNTLADYFIGAQAFGNTIIMGRRSATLFLGGDPTAIATCTITRDDRTSFGGGIDMPNLPTSDPHVIGRVWRNSGVLTVSAG